MIDFNFFGIDLSDHMLKVAAEKLKSKKNIRLMNMPGESLEFKKDTFDKVYISGSLHHFEDPYKGVLEILRVLKKGGKFCIMEPNYFFPTNIRAAHFVDEEIHMQLMKRGNFKKWFREAARIYKFEYNIINFAYTPPFPKSLIPLYDVLDRIIHRIPGLNRLSVMLFICGSKQ